MDARDAARRLARRLGSEVRQFTPLRSPAAARLDLFARRAIDVVTDVGADAGQYEGHTSLAEMLSLLGERGFRPVSLEPILRDDDGLLVELDRVFVGA